MMTDTAYYARRYIEKDMTVVPIPTGRKGPVLPNWQKLRVGREELSRFFPDGKENIGIVLGMSSNGLADVASRRKFET
jgi:hypothetical protein